MSHWAIDDPKWTNGVYVEDWMEERWDALPENLRGVALKEFERGNKATAIQKNHKTGIIVLTLPRPPGEALNERADITVYRTHQDGNYCYDGTECTIRDNATGHILAFLDPNYVEDAN